MQEKNFPMSSVGLTAAAVIHNFPCPIIFYIPQTNELTLINKNQTDLFGLLAEEKNIAEGIFDIVEVKFLENFKEEWNKCKLLRKSETHSFATIIRTSYGKSHPVKVEAVAIEQANGLTGILLTFMKFTGKEKMLLAEQEIEAVLTGKMAELNKERADFLYAATHDLMAPLRKLATFTERLFSKIPDDQLLEIEPYKTKILACTTEMRMLIENLSLLYETKQNKKNAEVCDLNLVMLTVINEMKGLFIKEDVEVNYSTPSFIKADKDQLKTLFRMVFLNALARKRKAEKLKIDVNGSEMSLAEISEAHYLGPKYYKITVTDNGTGFPEVEEDLIFKPFFRLQTKNLYANGLELAIAKNIVENHEGKIKVDCNKNNETQIIIILPSK